jgi:TrmH family RNA methyltransferase
VGLALDAGLGLPGWAAACYTNHMITSLSNGRVKQVRALQARRHARQKAGRFVIEGVRLMGEAVRADAPVEEVYYTEPYANDEEGAVLLGALSEMGASLVAVDEPVMQAMSDTQSPQGILAVLSALNLEPPSDFTFALVIDGINDPGNMGGIMRTAAAAGVPLMIVTAGTVDLTNPKVVRGAMGAHFRLPVIYRSWDGVAGLLDGSVIMLADSTGGATYHQVDWTQPSALIVSDEAHGPSDDARRISHFPVTIPMPGPTESLNVAVAAGVLLFEMVKQRSRVAD